MNPFRRKKPRSKRKEPRRTVEERLTGQAKTDRRWEIFERSGGKCEAMIKQHDHGINWEIRCNAPITWETMEWSHKAHGARKSDSMAGGIASCAECHQVGVHNPKPCKRRPGKMMSKKDAEVYWLGRVCFCEKTPKKSRESFCPDCRPKVGPQTLSDLENADSPDSYREALAAAEIEILQYKPEVGADSGIQEPEA